MCREFLGIWVHRKWLSILNYKRRSQVNYVYNFSWVRSLVCLCGVSISSFYGWYLRSVNNWIYTRIQIIIDTMHSAIAAVCCIESGSPFSCLVKRHLKWIVIPTSCWNVVLCKFFKKRGKRIHIAHHTYKSYKFLSGNLKNLNVA